MRVPSGVGSIAPHQKPAVNKVAEHITDVVTVATSIDSGQLGTVVDGLPHVKTVALGIKEVKQVAGVEQYVRMLAQDLSNIDLIGSQLAGVLNVSNNMAVVLLLHSRMADLLGVVPQIPNIEVLAGIDDELVGVYEALPQIVTLVEHLDSVRNVAGVLPQLDIIFNSLAELVALGNYIDEIKLVAANMESILEVNALTTRVEEMYAAIEVIQSLVEGVRADVVVRHEDISSRHADIEAIQADVKVDKDIVVELKDTAIKEAKELHEKAVEDITQITSDAIANMEGISGTTVAELTDIKNTAITTTQAIADKAVADTTTIKVEVEGIRDTAIEDIQAIKEEATAEADRAETWANASAVEAGKSEASAGEAKSSATEAKASEVAAKASEVAAKDSEDVAKQKADEAAVSAEESEDSSVDSYAYKLSAELSAIAAAASETASKAAETNAIKAMNSSYDYSELARLSANTSEAASADSVAAKDMAVTKATESAASAAAAKASETLSSNSQVSAATSANAAKVSEGNAATSATAAKASETVAVSKAQEAVSSATQAKASEQSAATDASKAEEARIAAELAVGTMVGGITDMGAWDASKGAYPSKPTRPMPDGSTVRASAFWKVVVSGVVSGVEFLVGDDLRYSAGTDEFYKVDNTDAVTSVQGKVGVVTLSPAEVGALEKPSGTFSANTVLVAGSINGTSKHSGFTIGKSVPSDAVFTDTVYTHPTSDGNKHVPANGTGNGNKFLMATATAGSYSWMTPTMSHIEGLPAALDAKLSAVANAVSASKLFAPVKINGVSFDGSADITITAASPNTLTRGTGLTGSNYNGAAATTWAVAYGSAAGTACQGNDVRLSDARVPKAHTHTIADVTSLQTTLDSKYSASNKPSATDVGAEPQGAVTSHEGKANAHPISGVAGLQAALDAKVPTSRKVNNKALTGDISLTASDVGALGVSNAAYYITSHDTRSTNPLPNAFTQMSEKGVIFDFKANSADGFSQGGTYHGVMSFRPYGSNTDTSGGGIHQLAFGQNGRIGVRYGESGWSAWDILYSTNNKPTAADVGALPLTGGTLTGQIKTTVSDFSAFVAERNGTQAIFGCSSNKGEFLVGGRQTANGDLTQYIRMGAGTLQWSDAGTAHKIYHTGNKPTAADVGLGSVNNTADAAKNVLSATKLTTARTIGGVTFDGTANINLPGVNAAGNQSTSGNAATATKLVTPRAINGTNFDGSAAITTANWGTSRTLTIGSTGKAVNGAGNVSWTLAEIGALGKTETAANSLRVGDTNLNTTYTTFIAPPSLNWWGDCGVGHSQMVKNGEGWALGNGFVFKMGARDAGKGHAWLGMTSYTNGGNLVFGAAETGSTAPQWATVYSTRNKPTAADVGALPITGGTFTGAVGVPTGFLVGGRNVIGVDGNEARFGDSAIERPLALAAKDGNVFVRSGNGVANRIYHQGFKPTAADIQNVVSPVSSGGIIERGSNANGEYVKFADGTMICTGTVTVAANTYSSTWTFPVAFSATPICHSSVFAEAHYINGRVYVNEHKATYPTSLVVKTLVLEAGAINQISAKCISKATAIGRWN